MGRLQERFRASAIAALNNAQRERRQIRKEYNRQKGPFRIKGIYYKIVDHREVKRRVKAQLRKERLEKQEKDRKRNQSLDVGPDLNPLVQFRIDIAKLMNAKSEKLAQELTEQTKKIHQQIKQEYGGLWRGFRNYRKTNRREWYARKKAEREARKETRRIRKKEKQKERQLAKNHLKVLKERYKLEVRQERVEKVKLEAKRREARALGLW